MLVEISGVHITGIGQTDTRAQVVDSFLLKVLAIEAAVLIIVGLVAVIGHDYFAWLLSY
jgi:hypothetical protein